MTRPYRLSTQPNPVPDASQKTSNGFSMSGYAKTGAVASESKLTLLRSHKFHIFLQQLGHRLGYLGEVQKKRQ